MAVAPYAMQEQQDHIALKRFARRIFLIGAALQSVLVLVNGTIFLFLEYQGILTNEYSSYPGGSFWGFLMNDLRIETIGAYAMGSIVFAFGAYLLGGIASYGLIEKNRPLLAVAGRTMLLPSMLASFGTIISFLVIRGKLDEIFVQGGQEFREVFFPLCGIFYVPALVTGMLAALLVRQRAIAQLEQNRQTIRKDWPLEIHADI